MASPIDIFREITATNLKELLGDQGFEIEKESSYGQTCFIFRNVDELTEDVDKELYNKIVKEKIPSVSNPEDVLVKEQKICPFRHYFTFRSGAKWFILKISLSFDSFCNLY